MNNKIIFSIAFFLSMGSIALANEDLTSAHVLFTVNNIWILVSAFLVFIMHLGFAALESG